MEAGPRDTGQDDTRREADPMLLDGTDGTDVPAGLGLPADPARLTPDGPDTPDSAEAEAAAGPEFEVELRPQRRLRLWQIAPIAMLAATGSLMFAFPLAFEFGDGGAVVAMLGFLISCCAGGWGMMAARRVGHTWPGLPARGSGRRPDWRMAALYAVVALAVVGLAVYRVARLR
ncbi:hypothetical protein [Streptomyces nojiriensis]|uniref:Membrane protein n=1 Tax=Streptomyces nojiriensis TaxID=66374 RepID=A0ABQ3SEZ1_9ACTN|nr:hypothetical protein [Streptomyces nojiriensis]QTI48332.1 hypothetical protein JYK04_06196 [Streptomyces nojiriensis]GGS01930.1 membrane protein [Streptomyces nojiriensis]GHI66688.1 membrane protein [Streptomyces nojiriensis]